MTRFELEVSERFLRRTFEKGIARSLSKILAELVTNSDDSYKRLESEEYGGASGADKPIRIEADRSKRRFSVVDQAQGLTTEEMKELFVQYGKESGDTARGYRTRSLFGKGLRDVLFTQRFGVVKSIKDGKCAVAEFGWRARKGTDRKPTIDINPGPKVSSEFRKGLGIIGNGTRVEFQLREDVSFPQHEVLFQKVRNFYMLRVINSNPKRHVLVTTRGKRGELQETTIHFVPSQGEILLQENLTLKFDSLEFPTKLRIQRAGVDLSQGEAGVEDRLGGLLVLDEDGNALDLTLFKYDRDPSAARIFGEIVIEGAGKYIRSKLNQTPPEEVLTETREGFDRKHVFYRQLASLVEPFLDSIVREEEKRRRPSGSFSAETQERLNEAMLVLNKLYEELVGKADTGDEFRGRKPFIPDVIAFIRNELAITEGVMTPFALLINTAVVPDGTTVKLSSSSEDVSLSPTDLAVRDEDAKEGLLTKICHLISDRAGATAAIVAEVPQGKASANVRVIPERIFYPLNGLDFDPSTLNLHEGKQRQLELYVDCQKVPIGSVIDLSIDNASFKLDERKVEIREHHKLTDEVVCVKVGISGTGIGNQGTVVAVCESLSAKAFVRVVEKKKGPPPPPRGMRFKQPVFEKIPRRLQTTMRSDGTVVINMADELNKRYFGDYPHQAVESELHCQVRLADLVLDECLNEIVTKAWGRTLPQRFLDDPATDIRMYVAQKKFEIGPSFHDAFVTLHERPQKAGALAESGSRAGLGHPPVKPGEIEERGGGPPTLT